MARSEELMTNMPVIRQHPVRSWRHPVAARDPNEPHRVSTPLELLFDLCFVVAVAQAAAQLHQHLAEHQLRAGLLGYVMVFFAIWWAWMNFTWFASAYDTDDVPYRLLTLLQIAGVLVLAAGVPAAGTRYDFTQITIGYVIMRIAMVAQWLRVARDYPPGRAAAWRYAAGISACQMGWVVRLVLPHPWDEIGFPMLAAAELAVPLWAESGGRPTSWHPKHINERYGLFTLIVLGECVLAVTVAVQSAVTGHGASAPLLVTAAGALVLIFGLWWSYFKHDAAEGLRASLGSSLVWGYGHYAVFGAAAALGAGLEVVIDTVEHVSQVSATTAALTVAIPVSVYLVIDAGLNARVTCGRPIEWRWVMITVILVLLAAAAAAVIALPVTIAVMGAVVASLVAAHIVRFS